MTTNDDQTGPAPHGELTLRAVAMPRDTNPAGDIFGGWLLSEMDVAGGITAEERARGRIATVGVEAMTFHRPVHVGDVVCCYAEIVRVGTTSIAVRIEAWALRSRQAGGPRRREKVTEGVFTYVAIDAERNKRPVPAE